MQGKHVIVKWINTDLVKGLYKFLEIGRMLRLYPRLRNFD